MAENIFTAPSFELHGRRLLKAQGVMTLVEYTEEKVTMLCRSSRISIRGTDLQVAMLAHDRAVITGQINGLEFF